MLETLFGSRLRAKLLSWIFTHTQERSYSARLAKTVGEDPTNVGRELSRLADIGLLTCAREGREKYYQADPACPVFEELKGLAVKTGGIADVVRKALAPLSDRIRLAFIYGSFATNTYQARSDVDLLIVGDVSFGNVVAAMAEPQEKLGREINPTVYPEEEFRKKLADGHHFITTVVKEPKIFICGDEHELAELGG